MEKTIKHLKDAFAGESQANRKYLAYAKKADQEGFPQAAKLFRAAAAAETVHAHAHLRVLKGIGTTEENLKDAISGETFEFKEMYPEMIKDAIDEGNTAAERSFNYANEVEKIHAYLYQKELDTLNQPREVACYYVCPVCGFTIADEAPETCPICQTKGSVFGRVD